MGHSTDESVEAGGSQPGGERSMPSQPKPSVISTQGRKASALVGLLRVLSSVAVGATLVLVSHVFTGVRG